VYYVKTGVSIVIIIFRGIIKTTAILCYSNQIPISNRVKETNVADLSRIAEAMIDEFEIFDGYREKILNRVFHLHSIST
jgi:hypothetical protein